MRKKNTWIMVADGARARIFRKNGGNLENATGLDYCGDNLRDQDLVTDSPGRTFNRVGHGSNSYTPRESYQDQQKALFTKKMCDEIDSREGEFDELILVSPPKVLGELRANLGKATLNKVIAEIPKNVTKMPPHELMGFLEREC